MKWGSLDAVGDHIFDLVQKEEGWGSLPELIRQFYPDARVAVLKTKSGSISDLTSATSGYDLSYINSYQDHYHRLNPWTPLHSLKWGNASVYSTFDPLAADIQSTLHKTEFYNDWIKPQDEVREGAAVMLDATGGSNVLLTVMLPARLAAEKLPKLKAELEGIARPLSMAMQIQGLMSENKILRSESNILDSVIGTGVMVVSSLGRLLHANKYAQEFIDRRDGLRLRADGIFEPVHDKTRSTFNKILATVCEQPQQWFVIERGTGKKPLSAKVLLLHNQTGGVFSSFPTQAMVIFNDPSAEISMISADRISQLLGLTKSEAIVALALLDCEGIAEIAVKLGLSRNTVRNQLASVMAKTGVTRQTALVRMLTQMSSQVANG